MRGFRSLSTSTLALIAALAGGAGMTPIIATQPGLTQAAPRVTRNEKRSLFGARLGVSLYGRKGAGISMAQQKRTATKKRGIVRNRRNHR